MSRLYCFITLYTFPVLVMIGSFIDDEQGGSFVTKDKKEFDIKSFLILYDKE